jgi:predicted nucleic acid-binding protein
VILVDSSVWIGYFRGLRTPQTDRLDGWLGAEPIAIGDIILAEVLQGFTSEKDFNVALRLMTTFTIIDIGGRDIAIQAARNFRTLRGHGFTIRKTIDALIATRCIQDGHALLHSDRDFDPFVQHLGLQSAMT